jgi:uncharacterized membrane protein HdeD (DUF308 family)
MADQMKSTVSETARGALPWQKGVAWWIVLIEGIVILGLGLYMFFSPDTTHRIIGWIIALSMIVSGGLSLFVGLRNQKKDLVRQWTLIYGGVGFGAGLIIIILLLLDVFLATFGLIILGLSCLAYAGVGLYILIDKNLTSLRRISVLATIFYLVIGVLLLLQAFGVSALATTLQWIKLIIIVAGVGLIFWGLILRNDSLKNTGSA